MRVFAALGLLVNIVCAAILGKAHDHHHDLNLKSAHTQVIADAATSIEIHQCT